MGCQTVSCADMVLCGQIVLPTGVLADRPRLRTGDLPDGSPGPLRQTVHRRTRIRFGAPGRSILSDDHPFDGRSARPSPCRRRPPERIMDRIMSREPKKEPRGERLGFRLTERELAFVTKEADHCGWTPSTFARQATLHAAKSPRKGKPREKPRADVAELAALTRTAGRIASAMERMADMERRGLRLPEHVGKLAAEVHRLRTSVVRLRKELLAKPTDVKVDDRETA